MILARINSLSLLGLEALPVEVEVDVTPLNDKSYFVIVGLPDTAVKESKDRVLTAIRNSGFKPGNVSCTVNLAPGDLKKEGPLYDLPIALGLLYAMEMFSSESVSLSDYCVVGELALSGQTRPVQGALALAMQARQLGKRGILLPAANAKEAASLPGIDIIPIEDLKSALQFFSNPSSIKPAVNQLSDDLFKKSVASIDFADIKGQLHVKRAMEIAAAGGHNVLLSGPPGSGKTMIAKAFIGIMPELSVEEALEATKIHSVAGFLKEGVSILTERPFRSPHHTISYAGLIGGGAYPRPGEVSLAHTGILFLDELPEFSRLVLEVLRQPLEDRNVTISRANGRFTFPTNFICIAAMNPCPCGNLGHPSKPCKDTQLQIDRYRSKISGPLLDRIDMHIDVPTLQYEEMTKDQPSESSESVRARVKKARDIQRRRYGNFKTNSSMSSKDLKNHATLDETSSMLMRDVMNRLSLSARSFDRLLKVARTIADLDSEEYILKQHLLEAINFRQLQF